MNIRVAEYYPDSGTLQVESIPYTADSFHKHVDGWFDHLDMADGLVVCFRQSREAVEDDIQQPAPWYTDEPNAPMFFCRKGAEGGFESLHDSDLYEIKNVIAASRESQ